MVKVNWQPLKNPFHPKEVFEQIKNKFESVDICFFSTGTWDPKKEKDIDVEQIENVFKVNFFGTLNSIKAVEEYFKNRQGLKAVLIFMDIRHPLKPIDLEMIKLCESSNINYVAVLTKSDKVSKNISAKTIQQVSEAINAKEILAISSLNKTGFEKLRKVLIGFKYE